MRRAAGPRLEGYAVVAALTLLAALALRRPELAIVALPFALVLTAGARASVDPGVSVVLALEDERTLEGRPVTLSLTVSATAAVERLEIGLELPRGIEVADRGRALSVRLRAGEERVVPVRLRPSRWGPYDVGRTRARARDRLGVVVWEASFRQTLVLRAYPREETLTRIVAPLDTQAFTGSEVSRVKGDGIEYADIRDYVAGDRLREINWRASARRTSLVVNERHPERNTDVVLLVDSFAEVQDGDRSTLDEAVRAAASLARRYLERRDRVGLVSFGGVLRWLQPGMGATQRYRLIETLVETGVEPTYTWRDINLVPARILPAKALVIALTPLVDPRFVTALEDLRARGFDLAVVEVDPTGLVEPGRRELERVAFRLWLLEREVLRGRLQRLGIAVARWEEGASLDAALEGVRTYRRYVRMARA